VDGEQLLTFRAAAVVDLLRRVEQEVVRLRRAANVGEIGAEEEAKLDEHRAAKGKDPFLATLAVHAERAAVGVEVANLDTGQLASPDAEEEQAEERETVARVLGDREEPRSRVGWQKRRDAFLGRAAASYAPSTRPENLRRLEEALGDLNARREDGREFRFDEHSLEPVTPLRTDVGELKIVPEPEGTRGYDDLRRAATREPLGQGVRPSVASLGDLARMLGARGREIDLENLRMLRRVIALERRRGIGWER
jgi:hypothetical protein